MNLNRIAFKESASSDAATPRYKFEFFKMLLLLGCEPVACHVFGNAPPEAVKVRHVGLAKLGRRFHKRVEH